MRKSKEGFTTLTKSESEVMNILWDLGKGANVRQVLEHYPDPKPAYTTVATFLKILHQKGFVNCERRENAGKLNFYKPLLTRQEYTRKVMLEVKKDLFSGSVKSLVNFLFKEEELSADEIRELLEMIERNPNDN